MPGIRNYDRSHNSARQSLIIANSYLDGTRGAYEVSNRLKNRDDPFAFYLAGEICLDQASKSNPPVVSSYLRRAREFFKLVKSNTPVLERKEQIAVNAKARLKLAQLALYETLFRDQRLPSRSSVTGIYHNISNIAMRMLRDHREFKGDRSKSVSELYGAISEASVLLLGLRATLSIDGLGPETWFPISSTFSEDHGGDCLGRVDGSSWDINIFTRLSTDDEVDRTYRLQVKTNKPEDITNGQISDGGLIFIGVNPDLSLTGSERRYGYTPEQIIRECYNEIFNRDNSNEQTLNLDARQDMLLELLG